MELFDAVELCTQVTTYLSIAGGIAPCYNMIKTGSTHGMPYPFFLVGLVNSLSGIAYGVLVNNATLLQINVVATVFNTGYVAAFILVSRQKGPPVKQLGLCGALLACLYVYVNHVIDESSMMDTFGVVLFVISTCLILTPLIQVKVCIDEQSASSLSLSLLISSSICSLSWLAYGLLLKDFYIYAPNILAIFTSLCQFGVLVIYGTKPAVLKRD